MTVGIGKYETALNAWRDAQAEADALIEFDANGGAFRLRVRTDNNDPVIAGLLDQQLRGAGYRAVLSHAIKVAQSKADQAAKEFKSIAFAEAMAEELDTTTKVALS
jgi:hypothetical protein